MSENNATPEAQVETTSVFRADLLNEMAAGQVAAATDTNVDNLTDAPDPGTKGLP